MPHVPASDALRGIKVLDLTRARAGPTCARLLADWGADVIKLEQPAALEPDGAVSAPRNSPDFQNLQRNRRSLTLNLKDADGLKVFMQLIETTDVVVENYRADVKNRLGIDYDSLRAVNPRIILGSISGFGQSGPYASRPGFDQIAQGMSGLMSITGAPGEGPMRVGIAIGDSSAGIYLASGILTALYERERSGQGQWVQTSLLEALIAMEDFQAARYLMEGEVAAQAGNNHPTSIPTGVFPTSDGHINIAASGGVMWDRLTDTLGHPEWRDDPRFADGGARSENRDVLNPLIAEETAKRTSAEWIDTLAEIGIPCGPIYDMAGMWADPQVEHTGMAAEVDSIPFGPTRMVRQPVTLSRTPSRLVTRPPALGEHTDEILEDLGYDADAIAALHGRDVV